MDADLDALATAFYVAADDLLKTHPERIPYWPRIGISPKNYECGSADVGTDAGTAWLHVRVPVPALRQGTLPGHVS